MEGTRGQAELGFSAQGRRGGPEGRIFGAFMRLRTANRQEKDFFEGAFSAKTDRAAIERHLKAASRFASRFGGKKAVAVFMAFLWNVFEFCFAPR